MTRIVLTRASTYPWTCPADCQVIATLRLIGGGSGGNGGVWDNPTARGGWQGKTASLTVAYGVTVTPGATYNWTIGDKGTGGIGRNETYHNNAGGTGGTTSFLGYSAAGGSQNIGSYSNRFAGDGENGPYTGVSGEPTADHGDGNSYYYGDGGVGYGAGGGGGDGLSDGGVYGSDGGDGTEGCIIIDYTPAPTAAFSGTPTSGNSPLSVSFTDSSAGTPTSWLWQYKLHSASTWTNFTNSTQQNPTQSFPSGTYDVKLTVTNANGSDVEQKDNYITANVVAPVANFSYTPTTGNAPLDVSFTDTSTNSPTSWLWQYSEDGVSWVDFSDKNAQNPVQTFPTSGIIYSVKLTATNSADSDTETKSSIITVTGDPTAAFSINPGGITNDSLYSSPKIKLYDRSRYYGATQNSWAWSLTASGETTITSTLQNPIITLPVVSSTKLWTVSLTVTDSNGAESDPTTATFVQHVASL